MTTNERKAAFIELGHHLSALPAEQLCQWQAEAQGENPWFTPESVRSALEGIAFMLGQEPLSQWIERYADLATASRKVGVVMAGNIPAVGFHDLLCVLVSGHVVLAKLSSQDSVLIKEITRLLIAIEPRFASRIQFVERLTDADAFIATGSNNSARYFHYYFGRKPHIIRQNRTSCAILTGNETTEELLKLGRDSTQYFGLGCRNVAKLYVPPHYDFTPFLESIEPLGNLINHYKYANNYDYQKAILLVNQVTHLDNGFLLLTPNTALVSPMTVLYYETYEDRIRLDQQITDNRNQLQCIVSGNGWYPGSVMFGQAQCPYVWEYADGIDTLQFLLNLDPQPMEV